MDKKTQGRRVPMEEDYYDLSQGEYGQTVDGWFFSPPTEQHLGVGGLGKHTITEHEDGTITVSPSILFESHKGTWHGYLERGVWREV